MIYRALNLWKKKVDKISRDRQFTEIALLYNGVPYAWGKENMEGVDCSGLISGTLTLMDYPIRTTADEFYKKFFTKKTNWVYDPEKVKCVFFVAKEQFNTPSGNRLAGVARHVSLLVGSGIVFHAVNRYAKFETIEEVKKRYDSSEAIIREIDWKAVEDDNGRYSFDPELQ